MVDQGVEAYLVASSIVLIIAQRLVRTICPHCKVVEPMTDEWRAKLSKVNMTPDDLDGMIAHGPGCDECFHSGYAGRTAIYEFLPVNERIRTMVMDGASATAIKKAQIEEGNQTLRIDGKDKIRQGLTTPDEVLRVTQLDV